MPHDESPSIHVLAKKNARWLKPSGTHFLATNAVQQNHTAGLN